MRRARRLAPTHLIAIAIATFIAGGAELAAIECDVGGLPGSTLLYPYFEVDPTRPDGLTTLISVNNDSATPALVRVTLWNEWSQPRVNFDLLLGAQSVVTMNLRDILIEGNLPLSGGPDLVAFEGCIENPPPFRNPALSPARWQSFAEDLSCAAAWPVAHRNARGFITVDTIRRCVDRLGPYQPYFDHPVYGPGTATIRNVLWGDLMFVDPAGNSAQGVEAVALRGDELRSPSERSFYGERDRRPPLPRSWELRFLNGGAFDGGTELIVFHGIHAASSFASCANPPFWFPLSAPEMSIRDENATLVLGPGATRSFPLATQKVKVADLRLQASGAAPAAEFGVMDLLFATDAWVIPVMTASGRFSVGLNAAPLDDACR
jgi:hypothetical protein